MNAGFGEGTDPDRDAVNAAIHARTSDHEICPLCTDHEDGALVMSLLERDLIDEVPDDATEFSRVPCPRCSED